eukprot:12729-Prymnesium_polylepis.1
MAVVEGATDTRQRRTPNTNGATHVPITVVVGILCAGRSGMTSANGGTNVQHCPWRFERGSAHPFLPGLADSCPRSNQRAAL